jgi:hypothetical protein
MFVDSATRHDTDSLKNIVLSFETVNVRFLRVVLKNISLCPGWHPGAGEKAWLFVDEIVVE